MPFLPPGDLSDPEIEPASPALQVDSLPLSHLGKKKMVAISLFTGQEKNSDVENEHVDRAGKGESRTSWEIRIDVYTLPCVKWLARDRQLPST